MTLDEVVELAERADAESTLSENFYNCVVDAAGQLSSRRQNLRSAYQLLQEGRTHEAMQQVARHMDGCPSTDNLQDWLNGVVGLHEQASNTRRELLEALSKLQEQERARVRHGGISIEIPDEAE